MKTRITPTWLLCKGLKGGGSRGDQPPVDFRGFSDHDELLAVLERKKIKPPSPWKNSWIHPATILMESRFWKDCIALGVGLRHYIAPTNRYSIVTPFSLFYLLTSSRAQHGPWNKKNWILKKIFFLKPMGIIDISFCTYICIMYKKLP